MMPKVIDPYAGAGGLSLGAARAGFEVAAAVENDQYAIETHRKNFPATKHSPENIAFLKGHDLLELAGLRKGELTGLIGGPPCQGFSEMGKRKAEDERNRLLFHFFRLVEETQPHFFLAENVPGILNEQYKDLRNEAFGLLGKRYELLKPLTIVASDYGAPTTRTRIFFIGYDPEYFPDLNAGSFKPAGKIEPIHVEAALRGLIEEIDEEWLTEESGWQPVKSPGEGCYAERTTGKIPKEVGDPVSIERYSVRKQVSGCLGTRHSGVRSL